MKKKEKKRKKALLEELEWMLERNRHFCIRNQMRPTPYMEGVNDSAKKMKKMVKKLYR
jgi:hypothetical protein